MAVELARAQRELEGTREPDFDPVYPDDPDEPLPIKLVA